ncbi:hypothetical protein [Pararhodobacter sp.]|nr:hypothetical protein [Pararhodobacter sp.]
MKWSIWVALAGLSVLVGCGAGEPPRVAGGMDLTELWDAEL